MTKFSNSLLLVYLLLFASSYAWATINHNPPVNGSPDYSLTLDFTVEELDDDGQTTGNKVQNDTDDLEVVPPVGSGSSGGTNSGNKSIKVTLSVTENGNDTSPTANDYFEVKGPDGNTLNDLETESGGNETVSISASDLESGNKTIVLELTDGSGTSMSPGPYTVTLKSKCSSCTTMCANNSSIKLEIPLGKSVGSGKAMNSLKLYEKKVSDELFTPEVMKFQGYGSDFGNESLGNPDVSKGRFLRMPQTQANFIALDDPTTALRFDLTNVVAGQYRLWARVRADSDTSLWISSDDAQDYDWLIPATTDWEWRLFDAGDLLALAGGSHSVSLKFRDPDLDIDVLVLTKDGSYTPSGLGSLPGDGESFLLEAEDGMTTVPSDPADPIYISSKNALALTASGSFTITGAVAGQHTLWVRARTPVGVDPSLTLDVNGNSSSINIGENTSWTWISMTNADLDLAAGDHDLALSLSGSNAYEVAFDSVVLTKDTTYAPTGLGALPGDGESYKIEAEDFTLTGDLSIQTGDVSTESGGDYIQADAQSVSGEQYRHMNDETARNSVEAVDFQYADYTISSLPDGSTRKLWIRARRSSASVGGSSLWIRFNDSGDFVHDLNLPATDTEWHWVSLSDERFDTASSADASLRLRLRDAGVDIDQWILTDNSSYSPSGVVTTPPSDGYRYDLMEAEGGKISGDLRKIKDLSQIKTGDFLMDVAVQDSDSYKLNYYASRDADTTDTNGLYDMSQDTPLNTIEIKRVADSDTQKNRKIMRIIESARNREIEFRVSQDEREWELKKGNKFYEMLRKLESINDLEQPRIEVCDTALSHLNLSSDNVRVEDRRLRDTENDTELRRDTIELTKKFPYGERVVCEIADPEGRKKKIYNRYYEGLPGSGNESFRGYLKGKERSGGDWETYDYEKVGGGVRKSKVIACFVNTDNDALGNDAQVTEYGYDTSSITLSDIDDYKKTVDRVKGVETGRSYYIKRYSEAAGSAIWQTRTITATVAGAAWNANSNLTRITTWIPEGTAFAGELRSVEHADGRLTLHTYSLETVDPDPNEVGDEFECVLKTTYEGYPSTVVRPLPGMAGGYEEGNIPGTVVKGTKTITYRRIDTDRKYEEEVIDIESGKTLSHYLWTDDPSKSADPYGRPTMRMNMVSGAAQYMQYFAGEGCTACAQDLIGSITDEQGIETVYEYDELDRRVSITGQGVTTKNVYDAADRIVEVLRAPEGSAEVDFKTIELNTYDKTGALVSRKVPGSNNDGTLVETTWTYEELSGGGEKTTTTYDDGGTRIEITAADGKLLEIYGSAVAEPMRYEYDVEQGMAYTKKIRLKEDPNASGTYIDTDEWTAEYSLMGRMEKMVYSDGAEVLYAYDEFGRLRKSEDPDGIITLYDYNADGERYRTAIDIDKDDPDPDSLTEFTETIIGDPASEPDRITETERLVTTRDSYNVQRTISKVWTDTDGLVVTAINDRSLDGYHSWSERFGQITHTEMKDTTTTDGNWKVTTTQPDDSYTVQTYTNGRLEKSEHFDSTASLLASTTYAYDDLGRQSTIEDSRTGARFIQYYDNDSVRKITNPDPDGDYAELTDGTRVINTDLDGDGSPDGGVSIVSSGGDGVLSSLETEYSYDSMGRRTEIIHPDDSSTITVYNKKGQVIKTYGSQQNPVEYAYDYAGRQKTMTTWQDFDYDETTGLGVGNSGSTVTTWIYDDKRGWLLSKQYPDEDTGSPSTANTTDYTYTPGGRLASRTWARGVVTNYAYNTAGDLLAVDYLDAGATPDVLYSYTRTGQKDEVVDGQFAASEFTAGQFLTSAPSLNTTGHTYDYDYNERLQVEIETVSNLLTSDKHLVRTYEESGTSVGRSTGYILGQLQASALDSGHTDPLDIADFDTTDNTATYGYDTAGRLKTVADDTDTFTYGYLANTTNLLETMTGPVHTTTYSYESGRNAMTSVDNRLTGAANPVSLYSYSYNELGQRVERSQSGTAIANLSTDSFEYDALGQITKVENDHYNTPAYDPDYNFDDIGNRTGDNIDLSGTTAYTPDLLNQYDSVGGVLYDDPDNNKGYDLDGNFLGDGSWTYTWNGENRLTSATNGMTTIDFEYDYQGRLVKKDDGTNVEVYLYDGWNRIAKYHLHPSSFTLQTSYLWGMDLSGSMQGAGGVGGLLKEGNRYPTYDANGNILQKLDANGDTDMEVEYDPFGNIISGTLVGEYGFSTKPFVDGPDWYYYGFRYYDPVTGRWPSRDPIRERGGMNLYGMVKNDLVNKIDYLGQAEFAIGIGASVTVVPAPGWHGTLEVSKTEHLIIGGKDKICINAALSVGLTPGAFLGAGAGLNLGYSPDNSLEGPALSTGATGGAGGFPIEGNFSLVQNINNDNWTAAGSSFGAGLGIGAYLGGVISFSGTSCYESTICNRLPIRKHLKDAKHLKLAIKQVYDMFDDYESTLN